MSGFDGERASDLFRKADQRLRSFEFQNINVIESVNFGSFIEVESDSSDCGQVSKVWSSELEKSLLIYLSEIALFGPIIPIHLTIPCRFINYSCFYWLVNV